MISQQGQDQRGAGIKLIGALMLVDAWLEPDAAWDDDGGRGLELVELMSDKWGWEPRPTGKNIWSQL